MDDDAIGLLIFYFGIAVGGGVGVCLRVSVGREQGMKYKTSGLPCGTCHALLSTNR